MDDLVLIIGNKNYSSWSLRAWLSLSAAGAVFEEILVPLDQPNTRQEILKHWRNGRVPILKQGDNVVWESLSICEYAAELFPEVGLWPQDIRARAIARSLCCEVHAEFNSIKTHMPMNIRSRFPNEGRKPGVQDDINRITAVWRRARERYGRDGGGPFLFGPFTNADAMFAPMVSRMRTYAVELGDIETAYSEAVWSYPPVQEWVRAAHAEPWVIENAEF
ncbi:MAG: glutathione S-transferase family protein [Alphaproteobacteria bacterium]|nr:glutathione S-transferase family protein [Alphaproteobacteria bacterium]